VIPTVSVCVPTHNRASSLRRTLAAILSQTHQDFEIIVGDDASTDNTAETVGEFKDARIRYCRHPVNLGIYANWNALIGEARGRFVCIYHDHDTYLPTILERSLSLIINHPDMTFVHTAIVLVEKTGVPLDVFANEFDEVMPGRALQERLSTTTRNTLCAASTMVRREAYAASGLFDTRYGLTTDRWMWFRLAALGSVGYVSEPQALILGRSRGDPTERFTLRDLLGNYRISADALGELWPAASVERWAKEISLRREVYRDLAAALLKAIVFGTPAEIQERAALVTSALPPSAGWAVRAAIRAPARPLLKVLARREYERRLVARQDRAIRFCRESPVLRGYLPAECR
jgi:glycosyltransferase involved in cell wall biosynthesis